MKKFLVILICLLIPTSLFAADITVGGAIGLSHSWMSGSDWDDYLEYMPSSFGFSKSASGEFRLGFELGAFCDIAINELFSVQPELNFFYMRVGAGVSESGVDFAMTWSLKILEIPVLAKFNFEAGNGAFFFYLGPAIQFVLGDMGMDVDVSGGGFSASASDSAPVDNSVLFAGVVGLGYAMPIANGKLSFNLRYRRAFTSFADDFNGRTNTIGLRVGYGLGL